MKRKYILFFLLLFICSINKATGQTVSYYRAFSSGSSGITAVKYNGTGTAFASGNAAGMIIIRDVTSSHITHTLRAHTSEITSLDFHSSGDYLVSTCTKGELKVWDLNSEKVIFETEPDSDFPSNQISSSIFAYFTVDNNFLIYSNGNGKVQLLPTTRKVLPNILTDKHENTFCFDYSLNANSLIIGNQQTVKIIDVASKENLFQFIACDSGVVVTNIKFNAQYWQVACLCSDETLLVFDVKTGEQLFSTNVSPQTSQVAFSPNGKYLAADDGEKKIIVWDMDSKKQISTLVGHQKIIKCLDFDANSQHMLSGSSDFMIQMWKWRKLNEEEEPSGN